jgi:hypothetical protein
MYLHVYVHLCPSMNMYEDLSENVPTCGVPLFHTEFLFGAAKPQTSPA